jgi:hypothetical protein
VHAVAGEQGAHAADPLANDPTGHVLAVNSHEVAPWTLNAPGAQGKQNVDEFALEVVEKVPAAQATQVELNAAPTKVL